MATPRASSSTAASRRTRRGRGVLRRLAWLLVLATIVVGLLYGKAIGQYARTGAAYGAHTGCSCHYIEGRPLGECRKDFEPGMALVTLSDDPPTRAVTARFALMAPTRATFVEGAGCQLDPWVRR